jgi:hypothetical protein
VLLGNGGDPHVVLRYQTDFGAKRNLQNAVFPGRGNVWDQHRIRSRELVNSGEVAVLLGRSPRAEVEFPNTRLGT